MIQSKQTENTELVRKVPSPAEVAGFIKRSRGTNQLARNAFQAMQNLDYGRLLTNEKGVKLGYSFGQEFDHNGLSPEDIAKLEALRLLLDPEVVDEISDIITSVDEASESLGLKPEQLQSTYDLLISLEGDTNEGDTIELRAIDFDRVPFNYDTNKDSPRSGGTGGGLTGKYLGRFRYDAGGKTVSVAMDAVPQQPNNAAYVIRNDNGYIGNMATALMSKKAMRDTDSYRQIVHTDTTIEGVTTMEGVHRRMTKALNMPYVDFLDRENIKL